MKIQLLFPHQLFKDTRILQEADTILLLETPLFFKDKHHTALFHKQKLMLHRASMKHYAHRLELQDFKVHYVDYKDADFDTVFTHYKIKSLRVYDPVDYLLERRLKRACKNKGVDLEVLASPNFLNTAEDNQDLFADDKWFMASFYKQQRQRLNILLDQDQRPSGGKWSFDKENRKKLPKNKLSDIPKLPKIAWDDTLTEAKDYVEANFPKHYGELSNAYYPYTHEQAENWLDVFLKERFADFGTYEDAIVKGENWLYHSVLTPMLNIGLLTPKQVIDSSMSYAEQNKIPIASLEGFIRQIIGWREFMRAAYQRFGISMRTSNHWQHTRSMPQAFYTASTGIDPIDDSLKRIIETGYCHHIERLMVLGGFMFLCEIKPTDIYTWFMEMFIDSYDWVMVPNVYAMSQNSAGGLITTKPYFSGSNYIRKMSHYKKDDWADTWDALYWRFILKHKDKLSKNPRWSMMTNQASKLSETRLKEIQSQADSFLNILE